MSIRKDYRPQPANAFKCSFCDKVFITRDDVTKHEQLRHKKLREMQDKQNQSGDND